MSSLAVYGTNRHGLTETSGRLDPCQLKRTGVRISVTTKGSSGMHLPSTKGRSDIFYYNK